jgi:hypothetical protein
MHLALKEFFKTKLEGAANFVTERIEVNIPIDDAYEGLINDENILRDFRAAAQHMHQSSRHSVVGAWYGRQDVKLMVRLNSTPKYPVFLMTGYNCKVTPESKLGRALALPVQVATQWEELSFITEKFIGMDLEMKVLAYLLPWMRDLLVESNEGFVGYRKREQIQIERDIRMIKDRKTPDNFPVLTQRVNDIRRNAKQLWGQYRMLHSTDQRENGKQSVVSVMRDHKLVSAMVVGDMQEIADKWLNDGAFGQLRRAQIYRMAAQ